MNDEQSRLTRRELVRRGAAALLSGPAFASQLVAAMPASGRTAADGADQPQSCELAPLATTAEAFHTFVMARLMDADGLCRSHLCAETLRPWTNEQLVGKDLTDMFQNAPDKAGCLAYENSLMSTGEFAVSQILQYRVTGEIAAKHRAQHAVRAILAVAEQGRHYMPGHLPKPFGGLAGARDSHEISPDQYTKALVALHAWRPLADRDQAAAIDRFFIDAADFFIARKFRHAYRHRTIVTAQTHPHALGLFVPLVLLAASASGDDRYRQQLGQFNSAIDGALKNQNAFSFNATSLLIEGFEVALAQGCNDPRLPKMMGLLWRQAAEHIDAQGDGFESDKPPKKTSQSTRLAAAATIVEKHQPQIRATELAVKILGRLTDIQQMRNWRMPDSISDTAITSWLLAYWRLREQRRSSPGLSDANQ